MFRRMPVIPSRNIFSSTSGDWHAGPRVPNISNICVTKFLINYFLLFLSVTYFVGNLICFVKRNKLLQRLGHFPDFLIGKANFPFLQRYFQGDLHQGSCL